MEEEKEGRVNVEDLPEAEKELTSEEAKDVQGGALLLPAVQAAREAARRSTSDGDNVVQGNLIGTDTSS